MDDLKDLLTQYQQTATNIQKKLDNLKDLAPTKRGEEHILIGKQITQLEEMYIDVCYGMKQIEKSMR